METQKESQMENSWCVYGSSSTLRRIGKVIDDSKGGIRIQISERCLYADFEAWDPRYVTRFPTLEEALKHLIEHMPEFDMRERPISEEDIRRWTRKRFPSEYSEK